MVDLKTKLQEISQDDKNLASHLQNVLTKILLDNPQNAYDVFEDYSNTIKTEGFNVNNAYDQTCRLRETVKDLGQYPEKSYNLIDGRKRKVEGEEDGEPVEQGPTGYVPNFLEEAKIFEQAGVYFGEETSYRVFKSLTRLSVQKSTKQVKLWGKILGSKQDYWVAEGVLEGGEEGENPPNVEPKGSGVNKMNYWVCNDLHDEWVELPVVTPEQIKVSRQIKYLFSGNLDNTVTSNPAFNGKERHLLKCQVVRISHSTNICQRGLYKTNEEDPKEIEPVEQEEGYKPPTFDQLKSLDQWVHYGQTILKEGRLTHFKPELGPDDDEEAVMKRIEAADPFETRLKPLSQDTPVEQFQSAWNLKLYGDQSNYQNQIKNQPQNNYGVLAIKSLTWAGFTYVYHNNVQSSIYVGYGFKSSNSLYFPKAPQQVLTEPEDLRQQPEPNVPQEVVQEEQKPEDE